MRQTFLTTSRSRRWLYKMTKNLHASIIQIKSLHELWAQVQNKTKEVLMSNKFCIEIQNHMYNLYN